jgi:hypothetical protein
MREQDNNPQEGKVGSEQFKEGRVARSIENQTAKMPSDLFLWGAGASIAASFALMLMGKKQVSTFVGQWVPTLLLFGVYNKIVKVAGHDRQDAS